MIADLIRIRLPAPYVANLPRPLTATEMYEQYKQSVIAGQPVVIGVDYAKGFGPRQDDTPGKAVSLPPRHPALPSACLTLPDAACFMRGR